MYCAEPALTAPSGECYAGFYCLQGAVSPNNPVEDATGGPCPVGHYCPNGTSYPLGCKAGSYSPTTGKENLLRSINGLELESTQTFILCSLKHKNYR